MQSGRPASTFDAALLVQHLLSVLTALLTLGFLAVVLRRRQPAGSALAWILAIVLIPYVGIPLYLMFGGRKVRQRRGGQRLDERAGLDSTGGRTPQTATSNTDTNSAAALGLPRHTHYDTLLWLDQGVAAYEQLTAEIDAATSTIDLSTFVVGSDRAGRGILQALTRRAREGLQIRLLVDDFLWRRAPHAEIQRFSAAGGQVARFMPVVHWPFRGQANLRNHRKIACFDGHRAVVGGMNLADEYLGPTELADRWRDLSVLVSGPAATWLSRVFAADWAFATHTSLRPSADAGVGSKPATPVTVVPSGPDCPNDPIYDQLVTAVFRAERRIWVATPYFVPDETLLRGLEIAVRRGVDVRIVIPRRSNHALADLVRAPYLRALNEAGAQIRFFEASMLHAKAVLFDDRLAVVGSANFDMRSLFLDYEISLFFSAESEVAWLSQWFDQIERHTSAGLGQARSLRRAAESVARLLAPLI